MENAYTSEVTFTVEGAAYTVKYGYAAIAAINTEMAEEVFAILQSNDIAAFSKLLAIGLRAHHPEMTAEKVMELSPPLTVVQNVVDRALTYAYFGPDGAPHEAEEETDDDGPKKKA